MNHIKIASNTHSHPIQIQTTDNTPIPITPAA